MDENKAVTRPTVAKSCEFYSILLNLLKFAFFEKRLMDRYTDGRTDGRTEPFVELLFATKNVDEKKILMKKQGHRHKSRALVKQNVKNVKTLKKSQRLEKTCKTYRTDGLQDGGIDGQMDGQTDGRTDRQRKWWRRRPRRRRRKKKMFEIFE